MFVFVTRIIHHMTINVHLRCTVQTPRGTILVYLHGVTFICVLFGNGEKAFRAYAICLCAYATARLEVEECQR